MNLNIIEPNYFKEFQCLCDKCKNTCCQSWSIFINRKEYIKCKNTPKSKELQKKCDNSFRRFRRSDHPDKYALLHFNENGKCPMLSPEGMCELQIECGYKILPQICKQFPRIQFIYLNSMERYLSTGCEEVVHLLMSLTDGIELINGGETNYENIGIRTVIAENANDLQSDKKFYWDIKTLFIKIMKNRNYSVEDRLILLGIAFKHIDELVKTDNGDKISSYVDGLIAACSDDSSMLDEIKNIGAKTQENSINFARILNVMTQLPSFKPDLQEKIKNAYGIVYNIRAETDTLNIELDSKKVEEQLNFLFNMISGREYIIENIMLNSMLYLNLPFSDTSLSFWDSYIYICMIYSLLMFFIAGNLTEKSDDRDIIDAITVFSRCLFHNMTLSKDIIETIKKNGFSSLGAMVSLIKF